MIRVLIVEDTASEADALRACLSRYGSEFGESFSVEWVRSAVEFMERRPRADLIFMDIDMPGITGMEAAELLRTYDEQTPLVFVTNLAQYAVRGYQVSAADFVVKPVSYADFAPRLKRVLKGVHKSEGASLALPSPDGTRIVPVSAIEYVDIRHHDLYYHLTGESEPLRVRGSIKAAAEELGDTFVKVSASCLANMAQVKLVRQSSIVMAGGDELFFSRACKKVALETLAAYVGRGL